MPFRPHTLALFLLWTTVSLGAETHCSRFDAQVAFNYSLPDSDQINRTLDRPHPQRGASREQQWTYNALSFLVNEVPVNQALRDEVWQSFLQVIRRRTTMRFRARPYEGADGSVLYWGRPVLLVLTPDGRVYTGVREEFPPPTWRFENERVRDRLSERVPNFTPSAN